MTAIQRIVKIAGGNLPAPFKMALHQWADVHCIFLHHLSPITVIQFFALLPAEFRHAQKNSRWNVFLCCVSVLYTKTASLHHSLIHFRHWLGKIQKCLYPHFMLPLTFGLLLTTTRGAPQDGGKYSVIFGQTCLPYFTGREWECVGFSINCLSSLFSQLSG